MTPPRTALVIGSARGIPGNPEHPSVWDDLRAVVPLAGRHVVYLAVNQMGQFVPRVHHICSLHATTPGIMRTARLEYDQAIPDHHATILTHSVKAAPGIDRVWEFPTTGTSSLFAVRVALALGYERVICCGVPLDSTGRIFDDPGKPVAWDWGGMQGHEIRQAWTDARSYEFHGRVTSMSGWTRHLLGAPVGEAAA